MKLQIILQNRGLFTKLRLDAVRKSFIFSLLTNKRASEHHKGTSCLINQTMSRKQASPILLSKGILMVEIMIAISLFMLFTISTFSLNSSMQGIKLWSLKELDILKSSSIIINRAIVNSSTTANMYGNYSSEVIEGPLRIIKSDFIYSWGESSCLQRIDFDANNVSYFPSAVFLGAGNNSTDIEVRNSIAYVTADSSIQSQSDLFIIDTNIIENPYIISAINTGPGLSSVAVAGPYIYAANTSSMSQLQIIDIHDRRFPRIISQLKLPFPQATTTAPKASSIYYKNGYIYLGTSKWDGAEFHSIDVRDPLNPKVIGSFETNTLVNDIHIYNDIAYLATSDETQMRMLDILDKENMHSIHIFSSGGWQVQQGKVIDYFEGILGLGRTVGGVNQITNHEVFIFSTSTDYLMQFSKDIPGGIYGMLIRMPFIYVLTHAPLSEFQVWDSTMSKKIYEISLNSKPVAMTCDWSRLYFATGDDGGLSVLNIMQDE